MSGLRRIHVPLHVPETERLFSLNNQHNPGSEVKGRGGGQGSEQTVRSLLDWIQSTAS